MTNTDAAHSMRCVIQVDGESRRAMTREDLRLMPAEAQVDEIHSMMPSMHGRGIWVRALIEMCDAPPTADHVSFHAADGLFSATLTLAQAREYAILLYESDGGVLPGERGGPFRLVTPGLGDLCANVKQVGLIEIRSGAGRDTRPPTVCAE